jgi:glycosyltransferase involved in cell wall biosynthesis
VFAFPTRRDEAAPLVVPEALASGTPVVASTRGGIVDVIDRPMENGMLVTPGDTKGFADAIRLLHDDPALRERIAAAGIARVRANYTLDRMVDGTLEVYRLALEPKRRRQPRIRRRGPTVASVLAPGIGHYASLGHHAVMLARHVHL